VTQGGQLLKNGRLAKSPMTNLENIEGATWMRVCTLLGIISLVCGCAASSAPIELPSCGEPVDIGAVTVVDAEKLFAEKGLNAVTEYATEQVGDFSLVSTSTFRSSTWPSIADEPRWIHAQEDAASRGCNVLILVDSEMLRLPGDARRSLYQYFLMGRL